MGSRGSRPRGATIRARPKAEPALPGYIAVAAFAALYVGVSSTWPPPLWVHALYLGLSTVAFVVYAVDKRAAGRGKQRVPESTLHLMAVAGGWPGALLAQQAFRHKTAKRSFRRVFWITVAVNIAGFVALTTPVLGTILR
jgi:uncharacterized membrane protein YsdA (DUF1294 family)